MSDPLKDYVPPAEPRRATNAGLVDLAAKVRQTISVDDPNSLYYKRPDLAAQADLNLRATLLRAGASERVVTPQALALQQHEAAFRLPRAVNSNMQSLLDERTEALEARGAGAVQEAASALKKQLGAAVYDRLVTEASAGSPKPLSPAAKADPVVLRAYAGYGRYQQAYESTRPKG